jgi:hypothetical protein
MLLMSSCGVLQLIEGAATNACSMPNNEGRDVVIEIPVTRK